MRKLLATLLLLASSSQALADPEFTVSLTASPETTITPGEVTNLGITLANSNTSEPITSVDFTLDLPGILPDGLLITGGTVSYQCFDPTSGNTIGGSGTLTATPDGQQITLTGGEIPFHTNGQDGSCTISVPITAQTPDGSSTSYTVTLPSSDVSGSKGGTTVNPNGDAAQSISVLAIDQPTIHKSFATGTLTLGGGSTRLTIAVSNPNTTTTVPEFTVTDHFPQAGGSPLIEVASPPNASASCNAGSTAPAFTPSAGDTTLSATGGTLAPNGSCTLEVDVVAAHTNANYSVRRTNTIDAVRDFSNDLGIRAASNATDNIRVRSPLHVTKSFNPRSLAAGETGFLRIVWRNDGDSDLTVESFTDSPIDGVGARPVISSSYRTTA